MRGYLTRSKSAIDLYIPPFLPAYLLLLALVFIGFAQRTLLIVRRTLYECFGQIDCYLLDCVVLLQTCTGRGSLRGRGEGRVEVAIGRGEICRKHRYL